LSNIRDDENAEELSGQIEGDMLIDSHEYAAFNGRIDSRRRWPNKTVPYSINSTFFGELRPSISEKNIHYIHCIVRC
jgi:hypothetical protein